MTEIILAHSEITNKIYALIGKEKIDITEQAIAEVKVIKALEQEPCEDCISRAEAIRLFEQRFIELQKVHQQDKQLGINWCINTIKDMPSVKQEPKTGRWIKIQSGDKDFPESIVCSRCKNENSHFDFDEHSEPIGKIFVTSKYCPNCGAKMESEGRE